MKAFFIVMALALSGCTGPMATLVEIAGCQDVYVRRQMMEQCIETNPDCAWNDDHLTANENAYAKCYRTGWLGTHDYHTTP